MSDANDLAPVTIARTVEVMQEKYGIELHVYEDREAATANLNGHLVTFAVLGSIAIVRAETDTEVPSEDGDANWYIAANTLNNAAFISTIIVDVGETLIVRTEAELTVAVGMTREQLASSLKFAIDHCLNTQKAMQIMISGDWEAEA